MATSGTLFNLCQINIYFRIVGTLPKYQTFWRRNFAANVDFLIFFPLVLVAFTYERSGDRTAYLIFTSLHVILFTAYMVICHGRFGHTIGKKLIGIKVLDKNEQDLIGVKRAFLRESPWFLAQLIGIIFLWINSSVSIGPDRLLDTYTKSMVSLISWIWFFIEILTMYFSQKRRALHDFLAGSVVVNYVELKREELYRKKEAFFSTLSSAQKLPEQYR